MSDPQGGPANRCERRVDRSHRLSGVVAWRRLGEDDGTDADGRRGSAHGRDVASPGVRPGDAAGEGPRRRRREGRDPVHRRPAVRIRGGRLAGVEHVAVADTELETDYVYANPDGRDATADGTTYRVDGDPHAPGNLPLERSLAFDAMWFAWAGFYPESTYVD